MNLLFLVIAYCSNAIPQSQIVERVRAAFSAGELVEQDYLPGDSRRGFHQYNDCNALQMLSNPDESTAGRALGPWVYFRRGARSVCATLAQRFVSQADTNALTPQRYTRYWHGYLPPTGALLTVADIATVRALLKAAVYLTVTLVLVAGLLRPRYLPLVVPVGFVGLFAWALPTFGQGVTHAYGDMATMLGVALFIFLPCRAPSSLPRILAFAAGYGAVVTYFDLLTGALPTAASFLFPVVYFGSRLEGDHGDRPLIHLARAAEALGAFAVGAMSTVAIHTALVAAFVRPHGLDVLWGQLRRYTRPVSAPAPGLGWVDAMDRLIRSGDVLTGGSESHWHVLLAASALAWIAASFLAWHSRNPHRRCDLAALAVGALGVPTWVALLQSHTMIHAPFMARTLIAPVALGFSALLFQLRGGVSTRETVEERLAASDPSYNRAS